MKHRQRGDNSKKESKGNTRNKNNNSVTETKNAFAGLIYRLDRAKDAIGQLKDSSGELSNRNAKEKNENRIEYSKTETISNYVTYV